MKILLLIFTLHFISGQVDCVGMTGYVGGSVLINCQYDFKHINHTKYFCKLQGKECTDKILSNTGDPGDPGERVFSVDGNDHGLYSVLIKNLSKQDDGTYRCGVDDKTAKPTDITLEVKEEPCCGTTLEQRADPGETVTFTCTYPEKYKQWTKCVYKATGHRIHPVLYTFGPSAQNGTLSLSDHPQENLFNVSIRNVTEEDGGVYLCGVQGKKEGDTSLYPNYFIFNEIQLEVTASRTPVPSIIIPVCVCVALLLIGGLAVIFYKLRHKKKQGSASFSSNRRNTVNSDEVHHIPYYEEIPNTQPPTTTVYATTQKLHPHSTADKGAEPPSALLVNDLYSTAQLSEPAADCSAHYATVDHHA